MNWFPRFPMQRYTAVGSWWESQFMSNLAALASVILLSGSGTGMIPAAGVTTLDTPVVAISSIGPAVGDETIQTAVDILNEARKAVKVNERRNRMKPGIQDRVVEKKKVRSDKVLIMGGKEAFPM